MEEEEFNPDYYEHLLSSLTINSRTLITELTSIAEKNLDHAKDITDLVETRIKKSLPQHKLNALYLLDSICKNVGNPYNLIFGAELYKIFTETYLVVTDTPTRQNLINLFKTWNNAKTSAGADLFPPDVVQKIEQFIIKATGISQKNQLSANNITPEMLLREGNFLLQYIIMLMDSDARIENEAGNALDDETKKIIKTNSVWKNKYVTTINQISESIMMDPKSFDANVQNYHIELQTIRKLLDNQTFQQRLFFNKFLRQHDDLYDKNVKIKIDVKPDFKYFQNIGDDIESDDALLDAVKSWGKPIKGEYLTTKQVKEPVPTSGTPAEAPAQVAAEAPRETSEAPEEAPGTPEPELIGNSLGLDFEQFNFMDTVLGLPEKEISDPTFRSVEDSYEPEAEVDPESKENKRAADPDDKKPLKRVRFDDNVHEV